jgi:hypothetical protein
LAGLGSAIRTQRPSGHGSRFGIDSTVIEGLVMRDLERHELPDVGRR